MRRRWKILLFGLSGVIAVVAVCFFCLRDAEPSYNGRTLSEWLDMVIRNVPTDEEQDEAVKSVRAIGTNAIPTLIKFYRVGNPDRIIIRLAQKHLSVPGAREIVNSAKRSYHRADIGVFILWRDAFPTVQMLMTNSNPDIREAATNAMHVIEAHKRADEHGIAE